MRLDRAFTKFLCAACGTYVLARRGIVFWAALGLVAVFCFCNGSARAAGLPCEKLESTALKNGAVTLTQIVQAGAFTPPDAAGVAEAQKERVAQAFKELPAFCRVAVTLKPTSDSDIRVEVWLPIAGWNGRLLGVGNGGWGGVINYSGLAQGLHKGFVTVSTDMGTGGFSNTDRSTWAVLKSNGRLKDFGFRSTHLMTVASKLYIQAFYGKSPQYSYWNGCSTGGKQGLAEAQRFPKDYDGIVEGDPASYFTHLMFSLQWYGRAARSDPAGPIPVEKLQLLHQAVLNACDALDGVADGIISDPESCHYDPKQLACRKNDGPNCLTSSQIKMVAALYGGAKNPRTGVQVFPGQVLGSELGWGGMLHIPGPTLTSLSYFQFALHRDPKWDEQTLNFDSDLAAADRANGEILNDIDPDLREFEARGGKLIMFHGWSDPIISPLESVEYYKDVIAAVGGASQAAGFVRLFMLPGVGHCQGGPGADSFDKISAIEDWTEHGIAPDSLVAVHREKNGVTLSRPLCNYPKTAHWKGNSDASSAGNFTCQ